MQGVLVVLAAAATCGICTYGVAKWMVLRSGCMTQHDLPDVRRLHSQPTLRGGGLGLLLFVPLVGLVAVGVAAESKEAITWWVLGFAVPNGLVGVWDDRRSLPSIVKLAFQFVFAYAYVRAGFTLQLIAASPFGLLELGWTAPLLTTLWIVWLTNVFNFMDGMDALAAISGILFMMEFAVIGATTSQLAVAGICVVAAGGLVGFLILNRPIARIFMGDSGALFVGALIAGATVVLTKGTSVPFPALFLVVATFVFDASYTLAWRFLNGENVLQAHCNHLYQRLARAGCSHVKVRFLYFGLNVTTGCCALILTYAHPTFHGLAWATAVTTWVGLVAITRHVEHRRLVDTRGVHISD